MNYAVFDIESNDWTKFVCMGFYDGKKYYYFHRIKDFINHIDSKRYNGYRIYAHNGGKFDFLFVIEELIKRSVKIKMIPRAGSVIIIQLTTSKSKLTFADSYALLPSKLSDLTKVFDVKHKKGKFSHKKKKFWQDKRLQAYTKSDVIGLYEVLTKFFSSPFVIKPQYTLASQAMNTFREKFLKFDLTQLDLDEENLIRERFYSGGRVEVYKGHGKNVRVYDINSLYPSVMLNEMPLGIPKYSSRYIYGKIGFYCVNIKGLPDFYISPLLHKVWKNNRWLNYYLNGDGEYWLTSTTLEYLKQNFDISFRVNFGYVFPKKGDLFSEFVNTFYKIKSENKDNAMGYIAKIFLNSLYGKFGQMRFRETIETWSKDLQDFIEFDSYYALMAVIRESRSKFILPYIAAYITELARLDHFRYLSYDSNKHYYCDTDSIFTTSKTLDRFVSNELGKLKFLGEYEGIFLAPKTYALRDRTTEIIKFKGFNASRFSFRDFKDALLHGKILQDTQIHPMSFKQCQSVERMREEGKESRVKIVREDGKYLKVSKTEKQIVSLYDRRIMITPHKQYRFDTIPFERSMFE